MSSPNTAGPSTRSACLPRWLTCLNSTISRGCWSNGPITSLRNIWPSWRRSSFSGAKRGTRRGTRTCWVIWCPFTRTMCRIRVDQIPKSAANSISKDFPVRREKRSIVRGGSRREPSRKGMLKNGNSSVLLIDWSIDWLIDVRCVFVLERRLCWISTEKKRNYLKPTSSWLRWETISGSTPPWNGTGNFSTTRNWFATTAVGRIWMCVCNLARWRIISKQWSGTRRRGHCRCRLCPVTSSRTPIAMSITGVDTSHLGRFIKVYVAAWRRVWGE